MFFAEGVSSMSNNEQELLNILKQHNSEQTILTAIKVFSAFLEQLEASPMQQADVLPESS